MILYHFMALHCPKSNNILPIFIICIVHKTSKLNISEKYLTILSCIWLLEFCFGARGIPSIPSLLTDDYSLHASSWLHQHLWIEEVKKIKVLREITSLSTLNKR